MENDNKEKDLKDALDSVNLINSFEGKQLSEDDRLTISHNVEHLRIIIQRHNLQEKEASVYNQAIEAGEKLL